MSGVEKDDDEDDEVRVRLDKWLWAARFWKTRRLALEACDAGHVKMGDQNLKPGRAVKMGDQLRIIRDGLAWDIEVRALSAKRGSGAIAQTLYKETAESIVRRTTEIERRRTAALAGPIAKGRPTKRDRRDLIKHMGKDTEDD